MKATNYSAEATAKIIDQYQQGVAIEEIAASIEKSVRSVRSKLVREGVYVAKAKPVAKRDSGPSKKELLLELEQNFGFEAKGLEGATKDAIVRIMHVLAQ